MVGCQIDFEGKKGQSKNMPRFCVGGGGVLVRADYEKVGWEGDLTFFKGAIYESRYNRKILCI